MAREHDDDRKKKKRAPIPVAQPVKHDVPIAQPAPGKKVPLVLSESILGVPDNEIGVNAAADANRRRWFTRNILRWDDTPTKVADEKTAEHVKKRGGNPEIYDPYTTTAITHHYQPRIYFSDSHATEEQTFSSDEIASGLQKDQAKYRKIAKDMLPHINEVCARMHMALKDYTDFIKGAITASNDVELETLSPSLITKAKSKFAEKHPRIGGIFNYLEEQSELLKQFRLAIRAAVKDDYSLIGAPKWEELGDDRDVTAKSALKDYLKNKQWRELINKGPGGNKIKKIQIETGVNMQNLKVVPERLEEIRKKIEALVVSLKIDELPLDPEWRQRVEKDPAWINNQKICTNPALQSARDGLKLIQTALDKILAVEEGRKWGRPIDDVLLFINPGSWQLREDLKRAGFDPKKAPAPTP